MCSSSCLTQDHKTWGECVRSKGLRIGWANSANGMDLSKEKRWDNELALYRQAVKDGHNPESTRTIDSLSAMEYGERTGEAYGVDATEPEVLTGSAASEGVFA